jgi:hypothetical protein
MSDGLEVLIVHLADSLIAWLIPRAVHMWNTAANSVLLIGECRVAKTT